MTFLAGLAQGYWSLFKTVFLNVSTFQENILAPHSIECQLLSLMPWSWKILEGSKDFVIRLLCKMFKVLNSSKIVYYLLSTPSFTNLTSSCILYSLLRPTLKTKCINLNMPNFRTRNSISLFAKKVKHLCIYDNRL